MDYEDFIRENILKALLILLLVLCVMNSGCQGWHYERFERHPVTQDMEKVIDIGGWSILMACDLSNFHAEVGDAGEKYLYIGEVKFDPDDEATKSLVEGIVAGVLGTLRP